MDKITELKAEAFDLINHREQVNKQVDQRLQAVYAEIGKLQQEAKPDLAMVDEA